jgi:hypothetical protein
MNREALHILKLAIRHPAPWHRISDKPRGGTRRGLAYLERKGLIEVVRHADSGPQYRLARNPE